MSETFIKKVISATLTSLLFPVIYGIFIIAESGFTNDLLFVIIVFFYALIGNYIYAIPVSFLSDLLTKKFKKYRFIIAAFIHIFFALITFFVIKILSLFAIACAVLFLLLDEWQRNKGVSKKNKLLIFNGISLVIITGFSVLLAFRLVDISKKETLDYYLIPKGYVGQITVVYNIKDAPPPKMIGEYKVIKINDLGYGVTSLPQSEGIIKNKYFYMDNKGKKEKINESCVHMGPSGSVSGGDGSEFLYSSITVTDVGCGEGFILHGSKYLEDHSLDIEEILRLEGLVGQDW